MLNSFILPLFIVNLPNTGDSKNRENHQKTGKVLPHTKSFITFVAKIKEERAKENIS